jgi:hypothetical protein
MTERYVQFVEAEDALDAYESSGPLDWMRDTNRKRINGHPLNQSSDVTYGAMSPGGRGKNE